MSVGGHVSYLALWGCDCVFMVRQQLFTLQMVNVCFLYWERGGFEKVKRVLEEEFCIKGLPWRLAEDMLG